MKDKLKVTHIHSEILKLKNVLFIINFVCNICFPVILLKVRLRYKYKVEYFEEL